MTKFSKTRLPFIFNFVIVFSYRTVVNMTKTEIISAAFRVWGRDFYRKTSLSHLAHDLGVSKPALYRHFLSKQALTNAMTEQFLDAFAAAISSDFKKALQAADPDEGIYIIIKSIAGFFARNVYALLFSLVNIYDRNLDGRTISDHLKNRGADINTFSRVIEKKYKTNPVVIKLIFATLTFYMANFHKINNTFDKPPSEEKIQSIISTIYRVVEHGLGFTVENTAALNFEKLEVMVDGTIQRTEHEPLVRAVAEVVAEAGPWDASMDMVARRMGLSKSSLYGHFKNKKDMLRRLFLSEFARIIGFARQGIRLSQNPAEQLYLGIYSIAVYLRSHPQILVALDWIRTRKLDLGEPDKDPEILRLFEDVELESLRNSTQEEKQHTSHWILFLLINTLTRFNLSEIEKVKNNDMRVLYKFITLGAGGFKRL